MASNASSSLALSSSPQSSEGLDSRHGSPETKVTAFSPEDTRTPQKTARNTNQRPPAFTLEQTHYQLPSYLKSPKISEATTLKQPGHKFQGTACKDPFLTTDTLKANSQGTHEQKLSPTASTFTPLTSVGPWSTGFGRLSSSSSGSNTSGKGIPVSQTTGGDAALQHFLKSLTVGPSQVQPIGQATTSLGPGPGSVYLPTPHDLEKGYNVIRALNIYNLSKHTRVQLLNEFFNVRDF